MDVVWAVVLPFVAVMVLLVTSPLLSQTQGGEGLDLLRSGLQKFDTPPSGDSVCYIDYSMTLMMRDSTHRKKNEANIKLVMNATKMHFVSNEMEGYQDLSDVFTVIPETHWVYRSDPNLRHRQKQQMQQFALLRDTLLRTCTVTSCDIVTLGGKRVSQITIRPSASVQHTYRIAQVLVWLDQRTAALRRMRFQYLQSSDIYSLDINYRRMEYAPAPEVFRKPVTAMFIGPNGTLLPKYAGYRLRDSRNSVASTRKYSR